MTAEAIAARLGAALLADERGRKTLGWVVAAILAPLILIAAVLCCVGSGGAAHNNAAVRACFYDVAYTEQVPPEYRSHVSEMRDAFALLSSAVSSANEQAEDGAVDLVRVEAVFFALCFGEDAPSRRAADRFAECFYTTETRTRYVKEGTRRKKETYTVTVPLSLEASYANVAALLGREITADDRSNIDYIYAMIAGVAGDDGGGRRGNEPSIDLDASVLADPYTKNAADLAAYAEYAWRSGWGYVWGSFGYLLTEQQLAQLKAQYPEMVGGYESLIRAKWLGGRTTDCVGLIKSYGWFDPDALAIRYGTNGMPDVTANQMYYAAAVSGSIDAIPEVPGLAVWCDGHIGVYVGSGEVIEARGTSSGVVKTKLSERHFTHWLQVPYINYDNHVLDGLYEKKVPEPVREFIDSKSKRPPRPAAKGMQAHPAGGGSDQELYGGLADLDALARAVRHRGRERRRAQKPRRVLLRRAGHDARVRHPAAVQRGALAQADARADHPEPRAARKELRTGGRGDHYENAPAAVPRLGHHVWRAVYPARARGA